MFCPHCGTTIPDNARFCGVCGGEIPSGSPDAADAAQPTQPVQPSQPAQAPSRKKPIIIAAVAVVLIALIAVGGYFGYQHFGGATEYSVEFTLTIQGQDADSTMPVPIHVTGTDSEGNQVDQKFVADGLSAKTEQLPRGSYTIEIPASPISSDGTMYAIDSATATLEITEDGCEAPTIPALTALDDSQMTPDMIEASYNTLVEYGCEAEQAQGLKDAATTRYETWKQEEEEKEELAQYAQPDGSYSASPLQWVEYVGEGEAVQGTYGTHVSIDSASMLLTMRTPDQTTTFKIGDNVKCTNAGAETSLGAISDTISSNLAKRKTQAGPLTTEGRLTAYVYGDGQLNVGWTVSGGVITEIWVS